MPYEILAMICEASPQDTIFNLALVCRRLRRVATNSLFVAPSIGDWDTGRSFRDACYKDPTRLNLMRDLECHASAKWHPWFVTYAKSLPNLARIHLVNDEAFDEGGCFVGSQKDGCEAHPGKELQCGCLVDLDSFKCQCHNHIDEDQSWDPDECERPWIDAASTLSYLDGASRMPFEATFVAPEVQSLSDILPCDRLRSLTLNGLEIHPSTTTNFLAALGASLPGLERLVLRVATVRDLARRRRIGPEDVWELWGYPAFGASHFETDPTAFQSLRNATLRGPCLDPDSSAIKTFLRRCSTVHIALRTMMEPQSLGSFTAAPVLQPMPALSMLRLRLGWDFAGALELCDRIAAGEMPLLRYVKIYVVGSNRTPVDATIEEEDDMRADVATRLKACGFWIDGNEDCSTLRGWRKK